ncbi:DUF4412 domain-containing protein [Segetibacter sp. 3557_3]|uniref:DUF4412 domain-containing protein n=1 Tax=Segetibacter sp. 3557_3 TaxID=2547429 RepID=UPI0010583FEA|nr:DUF4412 domain-containing protein [Segetibacter sp. 3557_3]TDH18296.1 DUF4412 domain-containing protein [Segetibacter sp. 3557_3]
MKSWIFLICLVVSSGRIRAQKIVSECTVVYELSVSDSKADPNLVKSMEGTTKTVYIKGSKIRVDIQSPSFSQSTFKDSRSDTTVILRELGNAKYMSYLSKEKVHQQNQKYDEITFSPTGESKTILGYDCKKAEAKLKDGSTYSIYYTTAIVPSNKEWEYQFRNLPGFALEYETQAENGKSTIKYAATRISIVPVQSARFDIPQSGYRIL